ncbi:uncharacterized protein LOC123684556 [Harmonia axyridis]|uniref:uncharacterized protein LOC123684556 n=1 Tax=Harmonia axyridis TaxID=115357 RepID=UPI001E277352|nr:uncharacterized protein LOC123684556 [Harmonia axyridis]
MGLNTTDMSLKTAELNKILWPYDELGPEVLEQIKKKNKLLQTTRVIITVKILLIGVICVPLSGDNGELTVFSTIKGDMDMPIITYLALSIMTALVKLYLSYAIVCVNYLMLFVINDVTSHILLVRKKLELINELYGVEDENYYDESYQKYVNETLRNCIDQHNIILEYTKMLKVSTDDELPFVTLFGILCLASLYIKAKMNQFSVGPPEYHNALCVQFMTVDLALMDITRFLLRSDLITTYRSLHFHFGFDLIHLFMLNSNNLRGHTFKLPRERFFTTTRQYFISNRVFEVWNRLPTEIVCALSVNILKYKSDFLASQNALVL